MSKVIKGFKVSFSLRFPKLAPHSVEPTSHFRLELLFSLFLQNRFTLREASVMSSENYCLHYILMFNSSGVRLVYVWRGFGQMMAQLLLMTPFPPNMFPSESKWVEIISITAGHLLTSWALYLVFIFLHKTSTHQTLFLDWIILRNYTKRVLQTPR